MKKANLFLLVALGTLGVTAFSTKLPPAKTQCSSPTYSRLTIERLADETKAKPDLLKTCPVSGEKLDGDMGKPLVFTYKDQEVKLCCKNCKKDFDKDPEKYIKLIRAADTTAPGKN